MTFNEFITITNKVHNSKFTYINLNDSDEVLLSNKIKVICNIHGEFITKCGVHLKQKQFGCKKCYFQSRRGNTENFIKKANKTHNFKYNYDKSIYFNGRSKLIITCHEHGDFEQTPNAHIYTGTGCPSCGMEKTNC